MSARNDASEVPGGFRGQVERRRCPRADLVADGMVFVDVAAVGSSALLVDVSEGGLGLQFGVPVPTLRDIELDFPLAKDRITARCTLAWSSRTTWGLKFVNLTDDARAKIRSWLDRSALNGSLPIPNDSLSLSPDGTPENATARRIGEQLTKVGEIASTTDREYAPPPASCPSSTASDAVPTAADDLPQIASRSSTAAKPTSSTFDSAADELPENPVSSSCHFPVADGEVVASPDPRETPPDSTPASRLGAIATSGDRNGVPPSGGQHDWVQRLMARQKSAREVISFPTPYDQRNIKPRQPAPVLPHVSESHDFDRAIRDLRAATATTPPTGTWGALPFLHRARGHGETASRRLMPILSVVIALAIVPLSAFVGFLFATRVSPPPVPLPSRMLGFNAIRIGQRHSPRVVADQQPRSSGELLALGDRCLDEKRSNCSCSTAVECFRAAAMLGHPGALARLATLSSTGECGSVNRVEAYRAFQQALASDPNPWIQWNLDGLWVRMNAAQRTQASTPQRR